MNRIDRLYSFLKCSNWLVVSGGGDRCNPADSQLAGGECDEWELLVGEAPIVT